MPLPHWLRECVQIMDEDQQQPEEGSNILNFSGKPTDQQANDGGRSALYLVYQAAELVGNMQEEACQREMRAQNLCRNAVERLQHAERRIQVAESATFCC